MQRLLTPLKSGTKEYLTANVVPVLTEGLTRLGIIRPEDPFLFLAEFMLSKSPNKGQFVLMRREDLNDSAQHNAQQQLPPRQQQLQQPGAQQLPPRQQQQQQQQQQQPAVGSAFQAAKALAKPQQDPTPEPPLEPEREQDKAAAAREAEESCTNNQESSRSQSKEADRDQDGEQEQEHASSHGDRSARSSVSSNSAAEQVRTSTPRSRQQDELEQGPGREGEASTPRSVAESGGPSTPRSQGQPVAPPSEAAEAVENEREEEEASETEVWMRTALRIRGRGLLAHVMLDEAQGKFAMFAQEVRSLERYEFSCAGVDFEELREVAPSDSDVVKEIARQLCFVQDEQGVWLLALAEVEEEAEAEAEEGHQRV